MTKKKSRSKPFSKKFGKYLGEYEDGGKIIKMYEDGNQIYFIKDNKIMPDKTIHIDDVEEMLAMLEGLLPKKEDK